MKGGEAMQGSDRRRGPFAGSPRFSTSPRDRNPKAFASPASNAGPSPVFTAAGPGRHSAEKHNFPDGE